MNNPLMNMLIGNSPIGMVQAMMKNGGNPKEMCMSMIQNMCGNNPELIEMMNMLQNKNSMEIENYAKDYFRKNGRDFNKEFPEFMKQLKG